MAQDPFQVDQLDIEPGSAGTRRINRASADGSLQFQDNVQTTPITLSRLAGIQGIANVLVVGPSGTGARYTTVQAALDAVPSNSSPTNPHLILIMGGMYTEDLTLCRDGVTIQGLGGVILRSALEATPDAVGASSTLTIKADLGTIPHLATLRNLTITNAHQDLACVRVLGAVASQVGDDAIRLEECHLKATSGAGGRPLWATSANTIEVIGGSHQGSSDLSLVLVEECAALTLHGVRDTVALQLDYDAGGSLPSVVGSAYRIMGCDKVAVGTALVPPVSSTLIGQGSLRILNCGQVGNLTAGGDRPLEIVASRIGSLTLNDTVAATLIGAQKGAVTAAAGATIQEPVQRGSVAMGGGATVSVVFGVKQPDNSYTIGLEVDDRPVNDETPWVTSKLTTGFDVEFQTAQTLNVNWTLHRVMGGATN